MCNILIVVQTKIFLLKKKIPKNKITEITLTNSFKSQSTNLTCIFVDNGLLRKDEFDQVLKAFVNFDVNIIGVDAREKFYSALSGITDPEQKRKAIGKVFIDVFDEESHKIEGVKWLAQGTIYPDVIESVSVKGPSATIKSHHNVGGLPEKMKLKLVEPLRTLFKDEVRLIGKALNIDEHLISNNNITLTKISVYIFVISSNYK